jgi:hypothetical protein
LRVNEKLTVNLALHKFTGPPCDAGDRYSNFLPTTPNPGAPNAAGADVLLVTGNGGEAI